MFTVHVHDSEIADEDRFDLIIIGSGSGNSIPEYLSDWKIAIVERGVFGGTCLNRGCIPSKMFVLPADVAEDARHSERLGVTVRFEGAAATPVGMYPSLPHSYDALATLV